MNRYTYRKRTFLAPISTGFTSYVLAEVESSEGGDYKCGNYILTLADCRRRIDLEFCLARALDRRQSLAKIDLLLEVVNKFRSALMIEAQLITEREQATRSEGAKKRKPAKGRALG